MENGENSEDPKQQGDEIKAKTSSLVRLAFEERLKSDPALQAMEAALRAEEKGEKLEDVLTEEQLKALKEKGIRQEGVAGKNASQAEKDKAELDKLRAALGHWKTRKPPTA